MCSTIQPEYNANISIFYRAFTMSYTLQTPIVAVRKRLIRIAVLTYDIVIQFRIIQFISLIIEYK